MQNRLSEAELKADQAIAQIDSTLTIVRFLTPSNLHEEQELFLAGKRENPQFTYQETPVNYDDALATLKKISIPDSLVGSLLEKKRDETINKLLMLKAVGSQEFTEFSKRIFGVPDKTILKAAHELLKTSNPLQAGSDKKNQTRLTSEAVASDLRDIIDQYGLRGWQVEQVTDIIAGVVVSASEKKVYVHAHSALEISRLAPIITHEIETHVLTTVNGETQPLRLFVQGFAGYMRTQEGLASYNVEWQHPELFHRPARFWSRNAIAVDLAQRESFRAVFNEMKKLGFSDHFSFGVASKVKRGLNDTSKPGGYTKDYVYLAGRHDVMNFIAAGGDLRDLYIGKINIEDLAVLKKQSWLKKPAVLPRFLTNKTSEESPKK